MNRKAEIASKKGAVVFVITFLAVFLFLYYGTLAMIGLARAIMFLPTKLRWFQCATL
jgi:hypothetical protein